MEYNGVNASLKTHVLAWGCKAPWDRLVTGAELPGGTKTAAAKKEELVLSSSVFKLPCSCLCYTTGLCSAWELAEFLMRGQEQKAGDRIDPYGLNPLGKDGKWGRS